MAQRIKNQRDEKVICGPSPNNLRNLRNLRPFRTICVICVICGPSPDTLRNLRPFSEVIADVLTAVAALLELEMLQLFVHPAVGGMGT